MEFPFILQRDSMQCGISCLFMVCKYYGHEIPILSLSQICIATVEGVSLKGISEAAEKMGLKTVSGRIRINKLVISPFSCILHWNQNHFVVLYKIKNGNTFYIADPGKGLVKYNLEEFKKHWISTTADGEEKGIAMFLEPTPAFYKKRWTNSQQRNARLSSSLAISSNTANTSDRLSWDYSWAVCYNSFYLSSHNLS